MTLPPPLARAYERTRKNSRARVIVDLIWGLTDHLGRGVAICEIREAFSQKGAGAPPSLTSEVHSLKRRGVIETVAGRVGHSLFALPGSQVSGESDNDEGIQVLRAVRRAWERVGRPLSTREVMDELRRMGEGLPSGHPNGVRKRLETLARARVRGPRNRRDPMVEEVSVDSALGQSVSYWVPAGEVWTRDTIPPRSKADWIRQAVSTIQRETGVPVERADVYWWYDQLAAEDPMREVMPRKAIGRAFADTLATDEAHPRKIGRLHPVRSPFTCYGGATLRVTSGPPSTMDQRVVHTLHTLDVLRVADELDGIQELRARARTVESEALENIAAVRESVVAAGVSEALRGGDEEDIHERIQGYQVALRAWLSTASLRKAQREKRERELRERIRHQDALSAARALSMPTRRIPFRVGQAGLFNLNQLAMPIQSTMTLLGLEGGDGRHLIARARRFPPSDLDAADRFGRAGDVDLALLDRVDVVSELIATMSLARASVLIEQAELILGHTLRDPLVILSALRGEGRLESMTRQAMIVALGWLGLRVEFDEAVTDPTSYDEVSAWVLSVVLADWGSAEARLRGIQGRVDGPALDVVSTALMRLDMGGLLTAVG